MNDHPSKRSLRQHVKGWLWHPILGGVLLFLPNTLTTPLIQAISWLHLDSLLSALHLATSPSGVDASRYLFIAFNWLSVPVLAYTIYVWAGKSRRLPGRSRRFDAMCGFALSLAVFFVAAIHKTPSAADMAFSRGFFLAALLQGSDIGLFFVSAAGAWLSAMSFAAGVKILRA